MRIHRIVISGFGPFRNRQIVDFDAFSDSGLFLIAGRTGVGKSSILDAITFGLYGTAPRYEGGGEARFRSDFAEVGEPTRVEVEFSVANSRYRVTRSPEYLRPSRRGTGLTPEKATATLEREITPGQWHGLAASPREVGPQVQQLVGLTSGQFLQVVLLAQNRFQEFLLASTLERRELLVKLFGADRFQFYENHIDDLRKLKESEFHATEVVLATLVAQLQSVSGQAEASAEHTGEITAQLATELLAAEKRGKSTAAERDQAQQALELGRVTAAAQRRRSAAERELELVKLGQAEREVWEHQLESHRRAVPLAPAVAAAAKASATAEAASQELDEARLALANVDNRVSPSLTTGLGVADDTKLLEEFRDHLTAEIALLRPTAEVEAMLPGLRGAHERAATEKAAAFARRESVADAATQISTETIALEARRSELLPQAALQPGLQANVAAAQAVLVGVREARAALANLEVAKLAAATAAGEQRAAAGVVVELWEARLAGSAGELAQGLEPDKPCPVCGSRIHPAPAGPAPVAVTDAEIAEAQQRVSEAGTLAESAHAAVATATQELAAKEAAAAGLDEENAVEGLRAAEQALATSVGAAAELGLTTASLTRLREASLANVTDAEAAGQAVEVASRAEVEALAKLTAAQEQVATALASTSGPAWGSLAEKLERLRDAETALRAVLTASGTAESLELAAQRARRSLGEAALAAGFESPQEVEAAVLPDPEVSRLVAQLQELQRREVTAQGVLAEPGMADLDRTEPDLTSLEATLADAEALAAAVTAELGALRQRQKSVESIVAQLVVAQSNQEKSLARYQEVKRLADSLRGQPPNDRKMRLIDYVLAAELEQIVAAGNARLSGMRGGRYSLGYTDERAKGGSQSGLGLLIYDAHTGTTRPTQSLSGGEKFLASLALALGLAETVSERAGGIKLDTLFIDEGFGSLDAETLETAMETLDDLRENGRTVGVISHVEAMHDRIPAKVTVREVPGGHSEIIQ